MDIAFADDIKRVNRFHLWLLMKYYKKHFGVTINKMELDLENCGNPALFKMWKIVKDNANKIEEKHQRDIIYYFTLMGLWYIYKDTAYVQFFSYAMIKILDEKEVVYPKLMRYYRELKDMYPNVWHDTKEHTRELKESGEMPDISGPMSYDEQIFVPPLQKERITKLTKQHKKRVLKK